MPEPTPDVVRIIEEFNRALAEREAAQMVAMAQRWAAVQDNLELYMQRLALEIQAKQDAGKIISEQMIIQMDRYNDLLAQIVVEAQRYEQYAASTITAEQTAYADYGARAAREALRQTGGIQAMFNTLNVEAVQNMAGLAGDGSPLFDVLKKRALAPDMVAGLQSQLIEAIALGYNPNKTAQMMASGLSQGLSKALVIARTEQIRVYRETSLANYRASGVVTGYTRHCAHDERNCMACLALDGEQMRTSKLFASHVQCRCFVTPNLIGDVPSDKPNSDAWLSKQSEAKQRTILGGHYDLWKAGTPLSDMVQTVPNKTWGPQLKIIPLKELKAGGNKAPAPKPTRTAAQKIKAFEDAIPELQKAKDEAEKIISNPIDTKDINNRILEARADVDRLFEPEWSTDLLKRVEYQAAKDNLAALRKQKDNMFTEQMNAYKSNRERYFQTSRELLYASNPSSITLSTKVKSPPTAWRDGIDAFNRFVPKRLTNGQAIIFNKTSEKRSFYRPVSDDVNMSASAGSKNVVHELSHWLESNTHEILSRAVDYRESRTIGETESWLGEGYARHEVALKDKFTNPYSGRLYPPSQKATEIISMGMEQLYADPVKFYEEDKDYFTFIVGLLED